MIKKLRTRLIHNVAWRIYHSEELMEMITEWQELDLYMDFEGVPPEKDRDINERAFEALRSSRPQWTGQEPLTTLPWEPDP